MASLVIVEECPDLESRLVPARKPGSPLPQIRLAVAIAVSILARAVQAQVNHARGNPFRRQEILQVILAPGYVVLGQKIPYLLAVPTVVAKLHRETHIRRQQSEKFTQALAINPPTRRQLKQYRAQPVTKGPSLIGKTP